MEGGKRLEPIEELHMELEDEHSGPVIEAVTVRKGELIEMTNLQVRMHITKHKVGNRTFAVDLTHLDLLK